MPINIPGSSLDAIIGDLTTGRPNYGPYVRLEMYRLLLYSMKDILETRYGRQQSHDLLYEAGKNVGILFNSQLLGDLTDVEEFVQTLRRVLKHMGVGDIDFNQADFAGGRFVITVSEDLDCSGLPPQDKVVCSYSEGLIAGLLEGFTGQEYTVREVDCWAKGGASCRFVARRKKEEGGCHPE